MAHLLTVHIKVAFVLSHQTTLDNKFLI